ncbi:FtsX-like permease family protein [Candidatus Saccharibacteria bacterium]|nr:FtsX-like permease family protein [Candidatus Saccharibacteria bacterium]
MARNSSASRAFGQRRHRRQWLSFLRMCRYGINNFTRNAWLTVAATVVMTITLLIVFITVVAQNVLADTTTVVGKRIDRSIYLKTGTTEIQAQPIIKEIKKLSNVESVAFVSTEEARSEFAENNKSSTSALDALNTATNKLPATIKIGLINVNDTSQLVQYVNNSDTLKGYIDPDREPTFMGSRKAPTETIANWTRIVQQLGIAMSVIFVGISTLIIFNTIRMAIFNRKEEIQMMKLIGADKGFIRGPFVVEAIVYGVIAAIIATALGIGLLSATSSKMQAWGIEIGPTTALLTEYIVVVLIGMIVIGALIGTISSLLATRRYLKI